MPAKKQRQEAPSRKKVFIVDDHPLIRQGLAQLIANEPDLEVCGEAETVAAALKGIAATKPDIAIVDISLKDASGLDLIKDMKVRFPRVPALSLSMHDESFYAERALRAGARGYIMKEEAPKTLMTAIRRVLAGQVYLSGRMEDAVLSKLVAGGLDAKRTTPEALSDRELEVFRNIGDGLSTSQIAEKLHLSVKTVETYREHVKVKLHLGTAAQLRQYAIKWAQSQK